MFRSPRCLAGLLVVLALPLAVLALPIGSATAAAPAPLSPTRAQQIGTDAYVYGIDLLEFVHQTQLDTSVTVPNQWGNAPVNQVGNQRVLTTPANQNKEIVGQATRRSTQTCTWISRVAPWCCTCPRYPTTATTRGSSSTRI